MGGPTGKRNFGFQDGPPQKKFNKGRDIRGGHTGGMGGWQRNVGRDDRNRRFDDRRGSFNRDNRKNNRGGRGGKQHDTQVERVCCLVIKPYILATLANLDFIYFKLTKPHGKQKCKILILVQVDTSVLMKTCELQSAILILQFVAI